MSPASARIDADVWDEYSVLLNLKERRMPSGEGKSAAIKRRATWE